MTVERQYGHIIFTCDQENSARCEGDLDTGESEWNAAMLALSQAHWRAFGPRSPGGKWIHCCSRCTVPRG